MTKAPGKAVTYLRVSSKRQMGTAVDVDADGNSIATQREACNAKAVALGATVEHEFMEPGQSAQTIAKRPVFRDLLRYVTEHRDIDYVIIYVRSRAFRNLGDAVLTKRQLEQLGTRLVSAKEDFGEGIMADAMEAVTDIMNEVQVRMSGEDIRVKMGHKAQNGGTLGRAKLGYRNVRAEFEGRLVNTISVDEQRAPLVSRAFELYATGEYSLERLQETLTDLGLTSRPTGRWPEGPVSISRLHMMLQDPYYTGIIVYKGREFPGRHEALITPALFERVQLVLAARSRGGQRDRVNFHYLKGLLWCDRCRNQRRENRLIFTRANGRGGKYDYYLCRGRQDGDCDLPYLQAHLVEAEVARHHSTLAAPADFSEQLADQLADALREAQTLTQDLHKKQQKRLTELDRREERFLDLAADTAMPTAKIQQRLRTVAAERERIEESLDGTERRLELGAEVLQSYLDLLDDPPGLYDDAADDVRRLLNETHFERLYVNEHGVQDDIKTPIAQEFSDAVITFKDAFKAKNRPSRIAGPVQGTKTDSLQDLFRVPGSSKPVMVELRGFEPLTPSLRTRCATGLRHSPARPRAPWTGRG